MPNIRYDKFNLPSHVAELIEELETREAPVITRVLIERNFEALFEDLDEAGIGQWCRQGMVDAVRNAMKNKTMPGHRQYEFFEIHPDLRPFADTLAHGSYYVENLREELPLIQLTDNIDQLQQAVEYMEAKALEVAEEARRLRDYYNSVLDLRAMDIDPLIRKPR